MTLTNTPTNALATLQTPCETPMQTPLQTQQTPQQTTYTQTPYNPQGVCAPLTRAFYPPANPAALALRSRSQALDRPNREIGLPFVRCWSLASRCTFALEMSSAMQAHEQKPRKERPIGRKLKQAIDLLLDGTCKNQKAACDRLKLSPSYLSRSLKSERIRVYVARRTRETIAASQLPATATVLRLLESARSEHVQFDAAKHMMALNGYHASPQAPGVTINTGNVGYVIRLATSGAEVFEGEISDVGGVLIGRRMTDEERIDGVQSGPIIDVSPNPPEREQ